MVKTCGWGSLGGFLLSVVFGVSFDEFAFGEADTERCRRRTWDRCGDEREPKGPAGGPVSEPLCLGRRVLGLGDESPDASNRGVVADSGDIGAARRQCVLSSSSALTRVPSLISTHQRSAT